MIVIYNRVKVFSEEPPVSYPPEHKEQTRARIVDSARRLWKAKGYANVTIGEIMKDAGLTHGGFYAHFKSKEELFAEAALDTEVLDRYRAMRADPSVPAIAVFEAVLDVYLSAGHRDNPSEGCPLVALSEDAWRMGAGVQAAYTELTRVASERLADLLGDDALAHAVLAAMVGAVQLARGVGDDAQSLKILSDTRQILVAMVNQRLG